MLLSEVADLFRARRETILDHVNQGLARLPYSAYQEFLLRTREGQERLRIFLDLFIKALEGNPAPFFEDQAQVGYTRASEQGFSPELLTEGYAHLARVSWETLEDEYARRGRKLPPECEHVQAMNQILFRAYSIIMASYLLVREERIKEKVKQLQALQRFTQDILTRFETKALARRILARMTELCGARYGALSLCRGGRLREAYRHPPRVKGTAIATIMERTFRERRILFMDGREGRVRWGAIPPRMLALCAPIQVRGRLYGVLCLHDEEPGFSLGEKDMDVLNQCLYIVAIGLENAFMLEEINQAREALRSLTAKTIRIQEEERKRLAADIHDTLTQTLIGISYKIQLCKELSTRDPDRVRDSLDSLLETVSRAVDESRHLISSLRPDLIDTIGLVPALERHVENFTRETGIRVRTDFQGDLDLPSQVNICLFRVAQEALMNVYKHARTKEAQIQLRKTNGRIVLTVSDQGRGFPLSQYPLLGGDPSKLGLLSMKERIEAIGGSISVDSGRSRGCRVQATVPYRPEDGEDG